MLVADALELRSHSVSTGKRPDEQEHKRGCERPAIAPTHLHVSARDHATGCSSESRKYHFGKTDHQVTGQDVEARAQRLATSSLFWEIGANSFDNGSADVNQTRGADCSLLWGTPRIKKRALRRNHRSALREKPSQPAIKRLLWKSNQHNVTKGTWRVTRRPHKTASRSRNPEHAA